MGKKHLYWCMGLVLPFVAIGCNSESGAPQGQPAVVGARALRSKEILVEFAEPAGSVADVVANYTGRVARLRFPELAGAGRIGGRVFVFQG